MFYCTEGSLPATPCKSGQYSSSLPGAKSKGACFDSVFVIVVINLPVLRSLFSQVEKTFQDSLAHAADRSIDYIALDIVQAGDDPSTTAVTSRIAALDAVAAAKITQKLASADLKAEFEPRGLSNPTLTSVTVTACVPGYELSSSQTCQRCPPNYYCAGGSAGRTPCPTGSFAPPGANSSKACIPVVFVVVSAKLPLFPSNFTSSVK